MMPDMNSTSNCIDCFAKLLNKFRSSKGVSLLVLGDRVGFSRTRMCNFENGALPTSKLQVINIANELQLSNMQRNQLLNAYRCSLLARAGIHDICTSCPCVIAKALSPNNDL